MKLPKSAASAPSILGPKLRLTLPANALSRNGRWYHGIVEIPGFAAESLGDIPELWYIESAMKPCIFLLVLVLVVPVFSSGCRHPDPKSSSAPLTLEGRVYVTGNEPFTELALETKGREVYIVRGDLTEKLRTMQGQWVRLRGTTISGQSFLYSSKGFLVEELLAILPEGETHE